MYIIYYIIYEFFGGYKPQGIDFSKLVHLNDDPNLFYPTLLLATNRRHI